MPVGENEMIQINQNDELVKEMREFNKEIMKMRSFSSNVIRGYIPSLAFNIRPPLGFDESKKPLFLEFGCGLGKNVLIAALRGFEAYGIEIRKDLVDRGNKIIQELKKKGLIDDGVHARLFYGNIMSKDIIRDVKNNLVQRVSKEQHESQDTIMKLIDQWLSQSLEFITDEQFAKIGMTQEHYPPYKAQLFELSDGNLKKIGMQRPEFLEKINFFLDNPYTSQGLDVYDVIGKNFNEFDSFYSYSWCENMLIAEMIRRHHPSPYLWSERDSNYDHTEKIPHILFLPLNEQRPDFDVDLTVHDKSERKNRARILLDCARKSQSYSARIFYLAKSVPLVRGWWNKAKKEAVRICKDYTRAAERFKEAENYQKIVDELTNN